MKPLWISFGSLLVVGLFVLTGCQEKRCRISDTESMEVKTFYCSDVTTYSQSFSPKGATNQTTIKTVKRVCREAG